MNKGMSKNWKKKKPFIFVFILVGISLLVGGLMLLWNAILPDVVGVSEISYWQAFGIFIISKILFGGFKGAGRKKGKQQYREKFMKLTDDQKETFRSEWKSRCD